MSIKLFEKAVTQFKRLAGMFKETPQTAVDDFELEHFLLYHGLIGTTPENQREFRDVRADIIESLKLNSSVSFAIALKLAPLWWTEKLAAIVSELDRQKVIDLIVPPSPEAEPDAFALSHQDWRVRANAAGILAHIDDKKATADIARLLDDTTDSGRMAFSHVAYALGQMGTEDAKAALLPFLYSKEAWIRVDSARALTLFPFATISNELSKALLADHALKDYMAVAIARKHKPIEFLENNELAYQGGLEMVIQIIEAASQTFGSEIGDECGIADCWPILNNDLPSKINPRQIRATLALANWLKKNPHRELDAQLESQIKTILDCLADKSTREILINSLASKDNDDDALGQKRHAAYLTGKLGITDAESNLKAELTGPIADSAIEALALLRAKSAAPDLLKMIPGLVDLNDRTTRSLSAQPVMEDDPKKARTYWLILKALGTMPTPATKELLIAACNDFAPDKRQQALQSLLSVIDSESSLNDQAIGKLIEHAINDPSPLVRMTAFQAVGQLELTSLIDRTIQAVSAAEISIKRQAQASLAQLTAKGHGEAVSSAIKQKLKMEFDPYKKRDLEKLLS